MIDSQLSRVWSAAPEDARDLALALLGVLDEVERRASDVDRASLSPWSATPNGDSSALVLCDHDPNHSDPAEADRFVAGCEHAQDAAFIVRHADPQVVLARVCVDRTTTECILGALAEMNPVSGHSQSLQFVLRQAPRTWGMQVEVPEGKRG